MKGPPASSPKNKSKTEHSEQKSIEKDDCEKREGCKAQGEMKGEGEGEGPTIAHIRPKRGYKKVFISPRVYHVEYLCLIVVSYLKQHLLFLSFI